jgi:hypothetical protein
MPHVPKDEEREQRLHMEIIVDAYGPEEQAIPADSLHGRPTHLAAIGVGA